MEEWALRLGRDGPSLSRDVEADYDSLVAVTRSGLRAVLNAQASWGELLLSGQLRVSDRAYRFRSRVGDAAEPTHREPARLQRVAWLPLPFVYAGLGYEESFEQVVRSRIARWASPTGDALERD